MKSKATRMHVGKPDPVMLEMARRAYNPDPTIHTPAMAALVKALEIPLRRYPLVGDNISSIFERNYMPPGVSPEYPLDFVTSTNSRDMIAYAISNTGYIPHATYDGDYIMVPTFDYGNSIDTHLKYLRDARWDVYGRMVQVLEAGMIRKRNNDAWHTILASAKGRGIVVYDNAATSGLFTKRLISLMKTSMRRNGGGNASSTNQSDLTDTWMSPELFEDMRSWDLTQIPDAIRQMIFMSPGSGPSGEMPLAMIFGVELHILDELGESQEYETYYENTLAGTLPSDKVEIVVGLDLVNNDSFVNPYREETKILVDDNFRRQRRFGLYAEAEEGWGALNSLRAILGAV